MAGLLIFKPLYVVGDDVEVYHKGKWQAGTVIVMRRSGYIEYDISLTGSGEVVTDVQAPVMRKVGLPVRRNVIRVEEEVIQSSQPEETIPYAVSQDILIHPFLDIPCGRKSPEASNPGSSPILATAPAAVGIRSETSVCGRDGAAVDSDRGITDCPSVEKVVSFIVENIENVGEESAEDTSDADGLNSRFPDISEEDLEALASNSRSPNTNKATQWGVGVFRDWLRSRNLEVDFENLQIPVMAAYLGRFYAAARNQKGKLYAKSSLRGIRAAIQRFLTLPPNNISVNIISDKEFMKANNIIVGAMRSMKEAGLDKTKHHPPITPGDMVKLYSSGALSHDTPTSLQWKTFFEITLHFGRRGREGLRHLKKEHIIFLTDDEGTEYATFDFHSLEKNHQGLKAHESEHIQRMYATGKGNCPVASLKVYLSRLHDKCVWLFQRPKVANFLDCDVWYCNCPVGVNTIADYMSKISLFAQTSQRYTNHCIRATAVTTLKDMFDGEDVIAVTGHKSTTSLMHYSKTSDARRKQMSSVLSDAISKGGGTNPCPDTSVSSIAKAVARAEFMPLLVNQENTDSQATNPYSQGVETVSKVHDAGVLVPVSTGTRKRTKPSAVSTEAGALRKDIEITGEGDNDSDDSVTLVGTPPRKRKPLWKPRKHHVEHEISDEDIEETQRKRNKELYDSPTKVPCSQIPREEDSSDSDHDGGNRSLFKGCQIDKIQIFYK